MLVLVKARMCWYVLIWRIETSGDSSKQQTGCREVAAGCLVSSDARIDLQERCKRVKSW